MVVDKPSFMCNEEDIECDDIVSHLYSSATYIMIVIAAMVVLIALFGCCGSCMENKCMLKTYFTLVLVLFIVMLTGAILGFGYSGNIEDIIKTQLEEALKQYNDSPVDVNQTAQNYTSIWNEMQAEVKGHLENRWVEIKCEI